VNFLVFQIALLFLPGLIWASIDAKYVARRDVPQFRLVLNAFLFGIFSYTVLFALLWQLGVEPAFLSAFDEAAGGLRIGPVIKEIGLAVVVSYVLAIAWVALATHKVFNRVLQATKITKRYGDEDLWDFAFNSTDAAVEYVHLRDFSKKIVYAGWVKAFSDRAELRELLLRDVEVYDFDSNRLFDSPLVYVSRKRDDVDIEFPYRPA
jgi:hypothetical protein